MKHKILILFVLLFVLSSNNLYSQKGRGPGSKYNKIYDINTVETIFGQATNIDKIYPEKICLMGSQLIPNISSGEISLLLGLSPVYRKSGCSY